MLVKVSKAKFSGCKLPMYGATATKKTIPRQSNLDRVIHLAVIVISAATQFIKAYLKKQLPFFFLMITFMLLDLLCEFLQRNR